MRADGAGCRRPGGLHKGRLHFSKSGKGVLAPRSRPPFIRRRLEHAARGALLQITEANHNQRTGISKHNACELSARRSSPDRPIIALPALLRLADWIATRRQAANHGGSSCLALGPALSPPAPIQVVDACL